MWAVDVREDFNPDLVRANEDELDLIQGWMDEVVSGPTWPEDFLESFRRWCDGRGIGDWIEDDAVLSFLDGCGIHRVDSYGREY